MAKLDTIRINNSDYEICGAMAFSVTLGTSWPNNTYSITNDTRFQTSGYSYIVTPASASLSKWKEADISVDDVTNPSTLTFHCETVPTSAITVNITRMVV